MAVMLPIPSIAGMPVFTKRIIAIISTSLLPYRVELGVYDIPRYNLRGDGIRFMHT